MSRLPITVERLALFGTLLSTFGELHPVCDQWVQGATIWSTPTARQPTTTPPARP